MNEKISVKEWVFFAVGVVFIAALVLFNALDVLEEEKKLEDAKPDGISGGDAQSGSCRRAT